MIQAIILAQKLILSNGREEPHIYHIYCKGNYNYVSKWITKKEEKSSLWMILEDPILPSFTQSVGNCWDVQSPVNRFLENCQKICQPNGKQVQYIEKTTVHCFCNIVYDSIMQFCGKTHIVSGYQEVIGSIPICSTKS